MHIVKAVSLAAVLALAAAPAVGAESQLQVSYPTDASLDCSGLAAELARAEQAIADANNKISSANGAARGAGAAGTLAVEGLMRSGLLSRAPGLGGLANQASYAAKQRAATAQQQAADQIRVAETRRAMLAGMSAGKACGAPVAVPPPQALPQPATAPGGAVIPTLPAAATKHY
ncbi:hypothetical protein ACO2Q0_04765 [Phenylobacterium sp. VNQ135]|uniref:hypothetical protein n=1 Tax=Phenylobacterium sp. VNQ135 TaxID=3400922 RepID=UPI003C053AD2